MTSHAMKPFLNFAKARERDMGWVKVHDENGKLIEHLGDPDPLDDTIKAPKRGYWQNPDGRYRLSTEEDEAGL
jgi:hypothetical protein